MAAWAAELGEGARCVAKQADDAAGALVRTLLERRGVELVGPVVAGTTGTVVALVSPDGERTMATDRGVSVELRADELEPAWFDCAWLHLSGYALLAEPIAEAALAAVRLARAREARVAVDLSSWSAIRAYGAAAVPSEPRRGRARRRLRQRARVGDGRRRLRARRDGSREARLARGRGAHGRTASRSSRRSTRRSSTRPAPGDALAAGFLVGGIELGLDAAARCVGALGAVPA